MWTLLFIIAIPGFASADMKFNQIPMIDRFACMEAANTFKNNSKGIGIFCISSETGEVITIVDKDGKPGKDQSRLPSLKLCQDACMKALP